MIQSQFESITMSVPLFAQTIILFCKITKLDYGFGYLVWERLDFIQHPYVLDKSFTPLLIRPDSRLVFRRDDNAENIKIESIKFDSCVGLDTCDVWIGKWSANIV